MREFCVVLTGGKAIVVKGDELDFDEKSNLLVRAKNDYSRQVVVGVINKSLWKYAFENKEAEIIE